MGTMCHFSIAIPANVFVPTRHFLVAGSPDDEYIRHVPMLIVYLNANIWTREKAIENKEDSPEPQIVQDE